jgi:S-formylglutathione hydrolase FrmB
VRVKRYFCPEKRRNGAFRPVVNERKTEREYEENNRMFVAAAPLSAVGGAWTFDQMKSQSDLSKVSEEKKAEVLGQMDIQTILEKSPKEKLDRIKWIRWYISCGDDDFLSVTNCLLHNTLLQHQVGHEFRMKDGSHSWTYWRMELPEVMRFVSRIFTQY